MQITYTGQTINRVVNTFSFDADTLVDLTVQDVGTGETGTISGTPEHPFFVPVRAAYVEMGDLEVGTTLRGDDGAELLVEWP